MAATHHVFGTVELLESILLELDFASLSRCSRVCRLFKATIDGSKALQRALWLITDTRDYTKDIDKITNGGQALPWITGAMPLPIQEVHMHHG